MNTIILRKTGRSRRTCNGILENIKNLGRNDVIVQQTHQVCRDTDILIRFGCTGRCGARFEINTPEMIHLGSDKIESRRKLIQNKIQVPRTFFTKQEALDFNRYPIIGRKRQHSQGREMVINRNVNELNADRRSEYWSEFISKDREYRVYVFFGRILAVSEKIPEFRDRIAWNKSLGNGAFVNLRVRDLPRSVGLLAIQACNALNIDFSAVDIISKGNQNYVLEFNNSPECSPYRQLLFARAFQWIIRRIEETGVKPEHFKTPRNERDKLVLLCRN